MKKTYPIRRASGAAISSLALLLAACGQGGAAPEKGAEAEAAAA
ncbi:MAG: hypothetical protein ACI8Y6_002757, partial [Brevundimonas sp.]